MSAEPQVSLVQVITPADALHGSAMAELQAAEEHLARGERTAARQHLLSALHLLNEAEIDD